MIHIGQKFNRLTVIEKIDGYVYNWDHYYLCKCDCGTIKKILGNNLTTKKTLSCGCLHKERTREASITHGESPLHNWTDEYRCWVDMKTRCFNKNSLGYKYYGGRGITVCKRWLKFENFIKDMGRKPPKYQLDRINTNGDYKPSNCRWATIKQNARNKRNNTIIKLVFPDGSNDVGVLSEMVEKHKLSKTCVYNVLRGDIDNHKNIKISRIHGKYSVNLSGNV